MKRYVIAGLVQAVPGLLLASVAAGMVFDADPARASSPVGVALLAAASLASAALAFCAYTRPRLRLPFALVELCWSAIYAVPVVAGLMGSARDASTLSYTGDEPLLRLTVALATAAASAGAEAVRRVCLFLLVLHGLCLVLALWGWIEGLVAGRRIRRER